MQKKNGGREGRRPWILIDCPTTPTKNHTDKVEMQMLFLPTDAFS